MLFSAVSFLVLLATTSVEPDLTSTNLSEFVQAQMDLAQQEAWKKVQPSIVTLFVNGEARGSAACIDKGGLFLAHKNSVDPRSVEQVDMLASGIKAKTWEGRDLTLHVISRDDPTGMVLLQDSVDQHVNFVPVALSDGKKEDLGTIIAALPSGPVRATVGRSGIVAALAASNQAVALDEVLFDAPSQLLAGALLFDSQGKMLGILGATVPTTQSQTMLKADGQVKGFGFGGAGKASAGEVANAPQPAVVDRSLMNGAYGPSGLTVAYALSPVVLSQVIHGFRSPSHEVQHPALGVYCSDYFLREQGNKGALVRSIVKGSPADRVHLQPGDIIVQIDGQKVESQVDYARLLLSKSVGQKIHLVIVRDDRRLNLAVVVGRFVPAPAQSQAQQRALPQPVQQTQENKSRPA